MNDFDGAIAEFRAAVKLKPDFALGHSNLGKALEIKGELSEALAEYRKASEIAPDDPWPLNGLAWLYATAKDSRVKDAGKALEYALKAARLSQRKDPQVLDTLAEAYFANGRFDLAIATENEAIAISPETPEFAESLERYRKAKEGK